jgi:exonuclease VII small subunit
MNTTTKRIEKAKRELEKSIDILKTEATSTDTISLLLKYAEQALSELVKATSQVEKDSQDAARYRFVARGVFMSDGRPTISHAQYDQGCYTHSINLTEEEANKIIDPMLA